MWRFSRSNRVADAAGRVVPPVQQDRHQLISRLARSLWQEAHEPVGRDLEFWLSAESLIDAVESQNDHSRIRTIFSKAFQRVLVLSIIVIVLATWVESDLKIAMGVGAICLAVAAASGFVSWLFGLLFGVPRPLVRSTDERAAGGSETDQNHPGIGVNTNLVDVSDWLTKTIIGVGLTQIYTIPPYLWHVAKELSPPVVSSPHTPAFILSIALTAGAGGFWLGYVVTRTSVTKLFKKY